VRFDSLILNKQQVINPTCCVTIAHLVQELGEVSKRDNHIGDKEHGKGSPLVLLA
jgi:hypothetical protein